MLSVLRGTVDRDLEYSIKGFSDFAERVISARKYICECCGFKSERFMRLVSLNGVYTILKPERFQVCCPFCFMTKRLERAKDKAVVIYLPEISQNQLNMFIHSLWHFSSSKSLNSTQYHYSNDVFNNLLKRTDPIDSALGDKAHQPENFAFALKSISDADYLLKDSAFSGIRLLPVKKGFATEIEYWSQEIYPRICGEGVAQWNALSSIMKKVLPDVQLPS